MTKKIKNPYRKLCEGIIKAKEQKELHKLFIQDFVMVEWGFKAHEKGWNLEKTFEEFEKFYMPKED